MYWHRVVETVGKGLRANLSSTGTSTEHIAADRVGHQIKLTGGTTRQERMQSLKPAQRW